MRVLSRLFRRLFLEMLADAHAAGQLRFFGDHAGLADANGFASLVKPLHKLAVDTAHGIGKVAVDLVGACKIPFAPDHIKKFEARSEIGKKRKSPKC